MKKIATGLALTFVAVATITPSVQAAEPAKANSIVIMKPGQKFEPTPSRPNMTNVQAWEVDLNGNKKMVQPFEKLPDGATGFTDGSGYQYSFDHYEQNYSQIDNYHFPSGDYSLSNRSNNTQTMSYKQVSTSTSNWTFTGKVSLENSFGNALLAQAKLTFGVEASRQKITSQGTEFGGNFTISPWSVGTLKSYNAGAYSGGSGVWKKYAPGGTSWIGMYYETGDAWTVAADSKHLAYEETYIPH